MSPRPISILDDSQVEVARLDVVYTGGHYEGSIDLASTPRHLRKLFEEYEEVVEGQMFSLLDAVEEKIGTIPLEVAFEDGTQAFVEDLQVFPSRHAVSFTARPPTTA